MNILERLGRVWKMQEAYNDYPQAASENAKKALRYAEKYGWKSCGTPVGKARARQLAKPEQGNWQSVNQFPWRQLNGWPRLSGTKGTAKGNLVKDVAV